MIEMTKDEYAKLVDMLSNLVLFIIALMFAWLWRLTDIPYMLVFTGWFLRSAYKRATISINQRG